MSVPRQGSDQTHFQRHNLLFAPMCTYAYIFQMNFQPKSLDEFLESGFFKVLAEPARLKLIQLLWKTGRASVGALAEGMTQDRSVVSRHLQALKAADLVTSEKVGRHFYYELKPDQLVMKLEFLAETVKAQFNDRCC